MKRHTNQEGREYYRRKTFEVILHKLQYNELPLTLSIPEMAAVLGISRAGTYELVRSDSFPKIRIGNRILVPKDKFIAWMDKQSEARD